MPCPSVTQLRNVAMLLEPFDNRGSDRVRTQCGRSGREVGRERAGIQGFADRGLQAACLVRQAQRMPQQQRSEEHTSELQSLMRISYAVLCLTKHTIEYVQSDLLIHLSLLHDIRLHLNILHYIDS